MSRCRMGVGMVALAATGFVIAAMVAAGPSRATPVARTSSTTTSPTCSTYSPGPPAPSEQQCVYYYTGAAQSYTVPVGQPGMVTIAASGAPGGSGYPNELYETTGGGDPGQESASFVLPAGTPLQVIVGGCPGNCPTASGQQTSPSSTGGYGGGGDGANGAGGGGGSFVFEGSGNNGTLLVAAGGGGGAGYGNAGEGTGSEGGYGDGSGGLSPARDGFPGWSGASGCPGGYEVGDGGAGASATSPGAGGAAGTKSSGSATAGGDGAGPVVDSPEGLLVGGSGGGGGGGGGYYGGGAGGDGCSPGGGGGGSNYASPAASDVGNTAHNFDTDGIEDGTVKITFDPIAIAPLVVNSTADTPDPASQLSAGSCNTTPTAASPTCTLRAAIEVLDQASVAQTISFDIPAGNGNVFDGTVPQIALAESLPPTTQPVTIDGTTQPGAGEVEITGSPAAAPVGLEISAGGATVRGLAINGAAVDLWLEGGTATVQDDELGTDPEGTALANAGQTAAILLDSAGNQIGGAGEGNVIADSAPAAVDKGAGIWVNPTETHGTAIDGNVIAGNWIGVKRTSATPLSTAYAAQVAVDALDQGSDTLGGIGAADGNIIAGAVSLGSPAAAESDPGTLPPTHDVVQSNTFTSHSSVSVTGPAKIGQGVSTPGRPAGNMFLSEDVGLVLRGSGAVVEGNVFEDNADAGLQVIDGGDVTIGGATRADGNLITGDASTATPLSSGAAGIELGIEGTPGDPASGDAPSSDDVIENNTIEHNGGDGGAAVYAGTGDEITNNVMSGNSRLGINLGGGPLLADTPRGLIPAGPNHLQPYPDLESADVHDGTVELTGQLFGPHFGYSLQLYTQSSCSSFGSTLVAGQGEQLVATALLSSGLLSATFDVKLPVSSAGAALTATVTSSGGDTSEFSPCLTVGTSGARFTASGASVSGATVTAASSGATATDAAAAGSARPGGRLVAAFDVVCPPVTTGVCTGRIVIRRRAGDGKLAALRFEAVPGSYQALRFELSAALSALLRRTHRIGLTATLAAHDGARHPHHKTRVERLTLVLAKGSR